MAVDPAEGSPAILSLCHVSTGTQGLRCSTQHKRTDPARSVAWMGAGIRFLSPHMQQCFPTGPGNPLAVLIAYEDRAPWWPKQSGLRITGSHTVSDYAVSQFHFSLFYLLEERRPISKVGGSELAQQIVTDLLLFIIVNMYRRKHINVFSHSHSKRNLLLSPIFWYLLYIH